VRTLGILVLVYVFGVQGVGFGVNNLGFGVWGLVFMVYSPGKG
jgi:hypothetical protein